MKEAVGTDLGQAPSGIANMIHTAIPRAGGVMGIDVIPPLKLPTEYQTGQRGLRPEVRLRLQSLVMGVGANRC